MADTIITFNGISSAELGFVVERVGEVPVAERKVEEFDVPGANGKIYISQDAFYNVPVTYDIYFHAQNNTNVDPTYSDRNIPSVQQTASSLNKWLYSEKGYCQLVDSNDPLYYREAIAKKNGNIENIMRSYGKCQIVFDCKPQRFRRLNTIYTDVSTVWGRLGMLPIKNVVSKIMTSSEPNQFLPSKPTFYIPNNTSGSNALLTVNSTNYQLINMPVGGVWIDCEKMVLLNFFQTKILNDCWNSIDFPCLYGDEKNEISIINGGVAEGETAGFIAPRWFTL